MSLTVILSKAGSWFAAQNGVAPAPGFLARLMGWKVDFVPDWDIPGEEREAATLYGELTVFEDRWEVKFKATQPELMTDWLQTVLVLQELATKHGARVWTADGHLSGAHKAAVLDKALQSVKKLDVLRDMVGALKVTGTEKPPTKSLRCA